MSKISKGKNSIYWFARTRPYPMAMLSGILLVLSFPPFPFAFLAYVAFVPLLLVMDHTPDRVLEDRFWGGIKGSLIVLWRMLTLQFIWRKDRKAWMYKRRMISRYAQIFRYCYTAFVIWNLGCCYWLMLTALGVSETGGGSALEALAAGLVAVLVNPFLMSIPVYLFAKLRKASRQFWLSLGFAFFWLSFEWMHFHWELSWSWLTLGHSQTFYPDWIQYIEFTGTLGVSAHILVVNIVLYQLIRAWHLDRKQLKPIGAGLAFLILLPVLINWMLLNPDRAVFQSTGELNVRVIQPNIDPYEKFELTAQKQVDVFEKLARAPGHDSIELFILPETAIPKYLWTHKLPEDELIRPLRELVKEDSAALLTGLTEVRSFDPKREEIPISASYARDSSYAYESYNSAVLLRGDHAPQTFQKGKLVPMVERMPFLEYFGFLKNFSLDLGGNFGGYGKPLDMHSLHINEDVHLASLICYESEYGDYIRPLVMDSANILSVITNDGWWNFENKSNHRSGSSGHIQHAHLSVLRSIENRRELARSANTGISMFVDNRGHIHEATDYWVETYADRKCKLYDKITFYTKHGDYIGWVSLVISLLFVLFFRLRLYSSWLKKPQTPA